MTDRASSAPKAFTMAVHAAVVVACLVFLVSGVHDWFGGDLTVASPLRRALTGAMLVIYLVRVMITQYVMLTRRYPWSEAFGVVPWVVAIQVTLIWFGATNPDPVGWLVWVGVVLYVVGSWLNTWSEEQRRRFKRNPDHRGQLYTGGLFRLVMHPNYLGDTVLFLGFALTVGGGWPLLVPALMALTFVYVHIPRLDAYLADRYGEAFRDYAARTKRYVPFVW